MISRKRHIPRFIKWEFWPFWFFYIPVYFKFFFDSMRSGSFSYFTLANPGMKAGGFSAYSKYDILRQISEKYLPKTILFNHVPSGEEVLETMQREGISFPVILKPDEGERGWKVEKICDEKALSLYLKNAPPQLMLQEYITCTEEFGIMYMRLPGEASGKISSVMKREFLSVTGDGKSSLLELFHQSDRCLYHLARMQKKFSEELNVILPAGEKKVLEEIGNHNRGTTFLDAHELINDQLVKVFDEVSSSLSEWYFGRFDVRTDSYQDMLQGNFKIVEVNGVNSEPAHIYDPDMSILKAYRDLFMHWDSVYRISSANRKRGFKPGKTREVITMVRDHLRKKKRHPNKI